MAGPLGVEIKTCLLCQAEGEAAEVTRLAVERQIRRNANQADIDKRLVNAMIAPRFADKTLDNYDASTVGQRKAISAARWLVDNLDSGTPGLILLGNNGTGKNHIASAIVREAVAKHNKTALITEVRKLDRSIKEAWRKDGLESEALKLFSLPDLLVIDEVGLQRGSETELLHLAEVINDRYGAMKPTVLIANLQWAEFKPMIGERAADRFREGGKVVVFDWQSYRGKVKSGEATK